MVDDCDDPRVATFETLADPNSKKGIDDMITNLLDWEGTDLGVP
jgi:hypothetical protein